MPRSPWLASAGCTNIAGVPVEASVAAILRPTWPLLPMPITTTRPRTSRILRTASTKLAPDALLEAEHGRASMSKVMRARASIASGSAVEGQVGAGTHRADFIGQGLGIGRNRGLHIQ